MELFLEKCNKSFGTKIPVMDEPNIAMQYVFDVFNSEAEVYRSFNSSEDEIEDIMQDALHKGTLDIIDGKYVFFNEINYSFKDHSPVVDGDMFTKEDLVAYRKAQKEQGLFKKNYDMER